jgi:hypothetical protein
VFRRLHHRSHAAFFGKYQSESELLKYSTIVLFVILSGCAQLPFYSGSLSISGDLVNHANEICSLLVGESRPGFGRVVGNRSVSNIFEERFVVPERSRNYRIIITCNNREIHRQIVAYPGTMGSGGTVALGVLL